MKLGIIVVDEESMIFPFKQMDKFRYSARDMASALYRAKLEKYQLFGLQLHPLETLKNAKDVKFETPQD